MEGSEDLRSKRELIEKFIEENLPHIDDGGDVEEEFEEFLNVEREKAIADFIEEHKLHEDKVEETMAEYTFSRKIDRGDIKSTFKEQLGLRERRVKIPLVTETIKDIIARFTW
jgi:type I restriction enzyme R subunit